MKSMPLLKTNIHKAEKASCRKPTVHMVRSDVMNDRQINQVEMNIRTSADCNECFAEENVPFSTGGTDNQNVSVNSINGKQSHDHEPRCGESQCHE
jgi:hypothetical protein